MSERKTFDGLDVIRVRASEHAACATCTTTEAILRHDVPALIAEVARLREHIEHHRHMSMARNQCAAQDYALWKVLEDEPSEINDRFWKRVGEIARSSGAEAE